MPINSDKVSTSADKVPTNIAKSLIQWKLIIEYVENNGKITSQQAAELLNVKQRRAREILSEMSQKGILIKQGTYKSTEYLINKGEKQ